MWIKNHSERYAYLDPDKQILIAGIDYKADTDSWKCWVWPISEPFVRDLESRYDTVALAQRACEIALELEQL